MATAEKSLEEETNDLLMTVFGAIVFALVTGMLLGTCVVLTCLKCYKRGQH